MLLNQCLAISLTFDVKNVGAGDALEYGRHHNDIKTTKTGDRTEITQATASCLFKQLAKQNSLSLEPHTKNAAQSNSNNNNYKLNEVFKRVEFAGFVLPTWLLLSGSYDDLHCIKSHWASGRLRPPCGTHIETIGEYTSRPRTRE